MRLLSCAVLRSEMRCFTTINCPRPRLTTTRFVPSPAYAAEIQMLENEVGFKIFHLTRNRIIGLAENGERCRISPSASSPALGARNMKQGAGLGRARVR